MNYFPSQGLLNLTKVILARTFSEDKCEQLTNEHLETLSSIVLRGIVKLDSRQRTVLVMRYGVGWSDAKTLKAVGDKLGLSPERIRQIELKALFRLQGKVKPYLIKAMFNIESEREREQE